MFELGILEYFMVAFHQVGIAFFRALVDHGQGTLFVGHKLPYQHGPSKFPELRHGMEEPVQLLKAGDVCLTISNGLYVFGGWGMEEEGGGFKHRPVLGIKISGGFIAIRVKGKCTYKTFGEVKIAAHPTLLQQVLVFGKFHFLKMFGNGFNALLGDGDIGDIGLDKTDKGLLVHCRKVLDMG